MSTQTVPLVDVSTEHIAGSLRLPCEAADDLAALMLKDVDIRLHGTVAKTKEGPRLRCIWFEPLSVEPSDEDANEA